MAGRAAHSDDRRLSECNKTKEGTISQQRERSDAATFLPRILPVILQQRHKGRLGEHEALCTDHVDSETSTKITEFLRQNRNH